MAKDIQIVGSLRLWPRVLAAQRLGLSTQTLLRWGRDGKGPPMVRLGRLAYYEQASLEAWLMRGGVVQKNAAAQMGVAAS